MTAAEKTSSKKSFPNRPSRVVCAGMSTWDLIFSVSHHPGEDEKMFASNFTACGGGPASNAAVTAARLGVPSAFTGKMGTDHFSRAHEQELIDAGVDTSLLVHDGPGMPVSSITVKPDGSRSVVNYRPLKNEEDPPSLPADSVSRPLSPESDRACVSSRRFAATENRDHPIVYLFDGHDLEASLRLLEKAPENSSVILDAGSVHEGTQALFPLADYLITSADFAESWSGKTDPAEALPYLEESALLAVITLGSDGLIWSCAGERGRLAAFEVDAVDSTGAGDVFHGAFAAGLILGLEMPEILVFASAAAALDCMSLGGRPGIPNNRQVARFLAERGRPQVSLI